MADAAEAKRLLPSYGRRRGRKLRPGRRSLLAELLPKLCIGENDALPDFSTPNPLWLEIGFGAGEHLAHQAKLHPDIHIIGCEPYIDGVGTLLKLIDEENIDNIRIFNNDARLLIDNLPEASLECVFILYPDPWPKMRHRKRRLVSTEFLNQLARAMKPGALLRLATDDGDYATWMLERLLSHPAFKWQAKTCDDWLTPPADWISTRYEQKALKAGRKPTYLNFARTDEQRAVLPLHAGK